MHEQAREDNMQVKERERQLKAVSRGQGMYVVKEAVKFEENFNIGG